MNAPGRLDTVLSPSFPNSRRFGGKVIIIFRKNKHSFLDPRGWSIFPRPALRENAEKPTFNRPRIARLPSRKEIPDSKSPIVSPDSRSKPAISRPGFSTLIPTGMRRDQKRPDKLIASPSRKNKPETPPRQKEDYEKKFVYLLQSPCIREWLRGNLLVHEI